MRGIFTALYMPLLMDLDKQHANCSSPEGLGGEESLKKSSLA